MLEMLHRFPPDDLVLVHQKGTLRRWQFGALIQALSQSLDQSGLAVGDRVLLVLPNSLELLVAYYACLASGLIAVPVNDRQTREELDRIISHCQPRLVMTSPRLLENFGFDRTFPPDQIKLLENLHLAHPEPPGPSLEPRQWPDAQKAIIFYTSGSTGEPKGVVYTHGTLRHNSRIYSQQFGLNASDRSVLVHCLAHNFVFAQTTVPLLDAGGSVQIIDFGNLEQTVAALESGATFASLIPWFGIKLLEYCKTHGIKPKSLRTCLFGGDRVPADIFNNWPAVFAMQASQNIGMTETNTYAVNDGLGGIGKQGSAGLPLPEVEIEIHGPDGEACPPGSTGEIWVKTPGGMQGYWKDEPQTLETMVNGWIATGDAGHLDEDGYLWFDSRIKNIIIRDGDNIYPSEVEQAISEHPGVSQVAVVGMPDAHHGEYIAAAVVALPGKKLSLQELHGFLESKLSDTKVPARLLILDALPLTRAGKVDREAIRSLLL